MRYLPLQDEQTPDTNACLFHLQWAAQANILCAQLALARLYSGFSGSLIPEKEDEVYIKKFCNNLNDILNLLSSRTMNYAICT